MSKDYIQNFRLAMLSLLENKLRNFGNFSSETYKHYSDCDLRDLEARLVEHANNNQFKDCEVIKAIIVDRIKAKASS
jgi:hypothetical protein